MRSSVDAGTTRRLRVGMILPAAVLPRADAKHRRPEAAEQSCCRHLPSRAAPSRRRQWVQKGGNGYKSGDEDIRAVLWFTPRQQAALFRSRVAVRALCAGTGAGVWLSD
jgi:hypothetical protein